MAGNNMWLKEPTSALKGVPKPAIETIFLLPVEHDSSLRKEMY